MRPPRLQVRTLLTAVAVVGAFFGGIVWGMRLERQARSYAARAADYAARETRYRELVATREGEIRALEIRVAQVAEGPRGSPTYYWHRNRAGELRQRRDEVTAYTALADHCHRLGRKYGEAARLPWLPVAPDPPSP